MGTLLTFFRWVVRKLAAASLIVVLGLSACGLWLFLQDNVSLETWRQEAARATPGVLVYGRKLAGSVSTPTEEGHGVILAIFLHAARMEG